jgi:hypothetical protein
MHEECGVAWQRAAPFRIIYFTSLINSDRIIVQGGSTVTLIWIVSRLTYLLGGLFIVMVIIITTIKMQIHICILGILLSCDLQFGTSRLSDNGRRHEKNAHVVFCLGFRDCLRDKGDAVEGRACRTLCPHRGAGARHERRRRARDSSGNSADYARADTPVRGIPGRGPE